MTSFNPYAWRSSDLEAIRAALSIPVSPGSIRAINDQMAALEQHYPDAIPAAKAHIDAISAIDHPPTPPDPGAVPDAAPVVVKVTRKGAAVPIPAELPKKKLDVIEYATELLMEEVSTEYDFPPQTTASDLPPQLSRRQHVEALLLILPRLASWMPRQQSRFGGRMIRG